MFYQTCSSRNLSLPPEYTESYSYGFQGQEKDDEIKGPGNSINYKYRMHDPRLGRFFAVDPLAPEYPHNSPYAFSENRVTNAVEIEGLEARDNNGIIKPKDNSGYVRHISVGSMALTENFNFSGDMQAMNPNFRLHLENAHVVSINRQAFGAVGGSSSGVLGFSTNHGQYKWMWNNTANWYVGFGGPNAGQEYPDANYMLNSVLGNAITFDNLVMNDLWGEIRRSAASEGQSTAGYLISGAWDGIKGTFSDIGYGGHRGSMALLGIASSYSPSIVSLVSLKSLAGISMPKLSITSVYGRVGIGIGSTEFGLMYRRSVAIGLSLRVHGSWALDLHTFGAGYGNFYKNFPSFHFHTGAYPGQFSFKNHVSIWKYSYYKTVNFGSPNLDILKMSKIQF